MDVTQLESPFTGGPVEEVTEIRAFDMRGQTLHVAAQLYKCVDTGELFTTGEQDEATMSRLQRQYRERNRVPAPALLTSRRKALGLSAREASKLLGFGVNQFSHYEGGELPSESNILLLHLFCDPQVLRQLLDARRAVLPARTIKKLEKACQALVRPVSKVVASLALTGGNWSGPGLYMAAPEHAAATDKVTSHYATPYPRSGSLWQPDSTHLA